MDASASSLIKSGRYAEALALLDPHLVRHPDDAVAWLLKAISHREQGNLAEAAAAARRAVALPGVNVAAHSLLGDLLEEQGHVQEAVQAYEEALSKDPRLYAALNGKGVALQRLGRTVDARIALEGAVALQPARIEARHNLAAILAQAGESDAACQHWHEVLRQMPTHRPAAIGMARALICSAQLPQALKVLTAAHQAHPLDAEIAFLFASSLESIGDSAVAEKLFRLAASSAEPPVMYIRTFGEFLIKRGRLKEAREVLDPLIDQGDIKARIMTDLALPSVYQSSADLERCRADYERNLARLALDLAADCTSALTLMEALQWSNFLLPYQGGNDLNLQQTYSTMIADALRRERPELYSDAKKRSSTDGRVKVGFVSSFFFDHTVAWYFQSWITELGRKDFDVRIYHLGGTVDWMTEKIRRRADSYLQATTTPLDRLAHKIRDDANDILIFPELGMCPRTFVLASLRLAPVQVMGWGHPVTSGHQNVDYILTPATMETAQGANHYAEQLQLLPGIGTAYERPSLPPPRNRRELGEDGETLIIVPQSLFKIHPDNDELIARVLSDIPSARILFFEDHSPENTDCFKRRLFASVEQTGGNTRRISWLPRTDRSGFLATLRSCNVMMDTLHWSGGNTSIDALACGLPIVTLPGQFMRSRQTHGMLGEIGLQESLSVSDADAYVQKVIELANSRPLREELRQKVVAGHPKLFDQKAPIEALQSFLKSKVQLHAG